MGGEIDERGSDRLKRILARIAALDKLDRLNVAFGASEHRYRFGPRLREREVTALEARVGARLPEQYREFVMLAGDGGVGPHYGLMPLRKSAARAGLALDVPFPHVEEWNLRMTPWTPEMEAFYFDDRHVQGSLPVFHVGCGAYERLVFTGPQRGNVWVDSRVNDGGVYPVQPRHGEQTFTDFLGAYEDWLDAEFRLFEFVRGLMRTRLSRDQIREMAREEYGHVVRTDEIIRSIAGAKDPTRVLKPGWSSFNHRSTQAFYQRALDKWRRRNGIPQ